LVEKKKKIKRRTNQKIKKQEDLGEQCSNQLLRNNSREKEEPQETDFLEAMIEAAQVQSPQRKEQRLQFTKAQTLSTISLWSGCDTTKTGL